MSRQDPIDDVCRAISEGEPVDWTLADTTPQDPQEQANVRGLHDLERVARYNRSLQRGPAKSRSPHGVTPPEQWSHLTLLELTGTGTTGAIWRAWDAWLQREVALKFLLTEGDGEGAGSALLEEARALARVRHSGVVAVYGIGEDAGRVGMWMELLVGNTLQAEIDRRGSLPPGEVAQIGLEICRALEAVGSAGLVHRDIKPANIIRESGGRVVLTDFGLGRRVAIASPELLRSHGTPLFMAPEVLGGEPATPRSDLYSVGVTLRWALTGRCPFRARTLEELKAEALAGPSVALRAERPDAPTALIRAIERAMAARADERYSSASQLGADLVPLATVASAAQGARAQRRWIVPAAVAAALLAAAIILVPYLGGRPTSRQPAQFSVTAPLNTRLEDDASSVAVSPDGRFLVFVASDSAGPRRLWLRPLDSIEARPLAGTERAVGPFWSPDSRSVGFFADLKIKKVSIAGGNPEVLCEARDPRGATWGRNAIVFAPVAAGPLCSVSAEGGAVTVIQRPDSTRNETALRWPQFLPDGEHFLFVTLPPRDEGFDVYAATPRSRGRQKVMTAGCAPVSAGSRGVILAENGRLMLQRFDFARLRSVGSPVALGSASASDVSVGQPLASASGNGVLARVDVSLANTNLVWLDRAGKRLGTVPAPTGRYEKIYLEPTGKKLLAERRDSPTSVDLWMIDVRRGEARRFTQGSQSRFGGRPAWSPDGSRIAFSSNRAGMTNIYQRRVNEAGEEELLYKSRGQFKEVECWSPDGRYLLFEQADPVTGWDLWLLPMQGKRDPIPYLKTRFNEYGATISPDGRWLVYTSDATGVPQVYVRSFPEPGVEYLVSRDQTQARWSRGGRELLYLQPDERWMCSLPISMTPAIHTGALRRLFRMNPDALYIITTPSGDRFLESEPVTTSEPRTILVDTGLGLQGR